ncbi:bactofilin family protein [Thermaerobacter litoralis]
MLRTVGGVATGGLGPKAGGTGTGGRWWSTGGAVMAGFQRGVGGTVMARFRRAIGGAAMTGRRWRVGDPGMGGVVPVMARLAAAMVLVAALMGAAVPPRAEAAGPGAADDTLVMNEPLTVPAGQVYQGDVISIDGPVRVLGRVRGDVFAIGGDVEVDGTVDGDVVAFGGPIRLGPQAVVRGDVVALGGAVHREPGAQVLGEVVTDDMVLKGVLRSLDGWRWLAPAPRPLSWFSSGMYLLYLAGLFALAVMVQALFPRPVARWSAVIENDPLRTGLYGLAAMVLFYPAVVLVGITVIGIPVALALGVAYALARLGGYVAVASLVGRKVVPGRDPLLMLAVGVALLGLLRYVPVVGWASGLVVAALAVGAVIQTRFGTVDGPAAGRGPVPPGRPPAGAGTPGGTGASGDEPATSPVGTGTPH